MPKGVYKRNKKEIRRLKKFVKIYGFKKGQPKPKNAYSFSIGQPKPKNAYSFKKGHPTYLKHHSKEAIDKIRQSKQNFRNPNWKGGEYIDNDGYKRILCNTYPYKNKDSYVLEHRLIMEKYLGRCLKPTEVIHHINNKPSDNRIENFIVFKNCGHHCVFHRWNHYNPKNVIFDGRNL